MEVIVDFDVCSSMFVVKGGKPKSCARIMIDIYRHEGPRHLMKGLLPRLIAVPSMMSVFYVINEELEHRILGTRLV